MNKLNKILLSSTLMPVVSAGLLPLAGCSKPVPEGYVNINEWSKALQKIMFLGVTNPSFYSTGWDDHITLSLPDDTIVYRLENFIVNKNIIGAKDVKSGKNWFDLFNRRIDYSMHGTAYEINDLYESQIPKFFVYYCAIIINDYASYKFDEYAQQFTFQGDVPSLLIKDVNSILAFNKNKELSLIRITYTNLNESYVEQSKVDIELHLKYESKDVPVDPSFLQRVMNHTKTIQGSTSNTVDMTIASSEKEGFVWAIDGIVNGSNSISITDNSTPVDIFGGQENKPAIYKNGILLEENDYTLSTGKITFSQQLKSNDSISMFFKPKVFEKAYTVTVA